MTGETVKVAVGFPKARIAQLTTDHAASCQGQPVLLIDGKAHGPADYPETVLSVSHCGPVIPEAAMIGQAVTEEPRIVQLWNRSVMRTRGIDC